MTYSYGEARFDTITFTNSGVNQSVNVSGFVRNPIISGNMNVTGTITGTTITGTTANVTTINAVTGNYTTRVSGDTVTGNTGQFTTLTGDTAGFTTVTGTTITGTTVNAAIGNISTVTGVSGTFTTRLSGATITGDNGQYANITGVSGVFTANLSGTVITGNTGRFTDVTGVDIVGTTEVSGLVVTGNTGRFTTVTGDTATFTTSVSGTTITGNTGQFTTLTGGTAGFTTVTGATVTGAAGLFTAITGQTVSGVLLHTLSGVTFPAAETSSANANTLDDYEEGTFTPTIIGTTAAGAGTYSVQVGRYTKMGDTVFILAILVWSAHTGTGNMRVGNFPFVTDPTANNVPPVNVVCSNMTTTSGHLVQALIAAGTTYADLYSTLVTGVAQTLVAKAIDTAASLYVQCFYEVSGF